MRSIFGFIVAVVVVHSEYCSPGEELDNQTVPSDFSVGTTSRGKSVVEGKPFLFPDDTLPFVDSGGIEAGGFSAPAPFLLTKGRNWADIGIGGGRGSPAMLLGYSYLTGNIHLGARMIFTFPVFVVESRQQVSLFEAGALIGLGFKSRFLTVTVSTGVSYVSGSDSRGRYLTFSGAALPFDGEIALTPFESFGVALRGFAVLHSDFSWGGFFLALHIGL